MPFPRAAPIKPKKVNRIAQMKIFTGVSFVGVGVYAILDALFDHTSKCKNIAQAIINEEQPRGTRNIEARIKVLDEAAKYNTVPGVVGYVDAKQLREAKSKYEDAQMPNEVREFFIKKSEKEKSENQNNFTSVEKVEPGVHGKVIVTRLPKENQSNETKE